MGEKVRNKNSKLYKVKSVDNIILCNIVLLKILNYLVSLFEGFRFYLPVMGLTNPRNTEIAGACLQDSSIET